MRIRIRYLVVAGAVAAMAGAPAAAADNSNQTCTTTGSATQCSSPGNVQITDSPPVMADPFTLPYWDEVWGGGAYPGPYPVPYNQSSGQRG